LVTGLELMANKAHVIVQNMKKKKYDPLDARKDLYDNDFEEFKKAIDDLQVRACHKMEAVLVKRSERSA
jgi:hypothetical protein